ncbi:MAG: sialidase family protein [Gemmatimonadota bacterium]|nr:sialidase family protein [Gemmatimonadota bacterium]
MRRHDVTPIRATRTVLVGLGLCAVGLLTCVLPALAQERTSRLDRVFQGLAYRPLEVERDGALDALARPLDDFRVSAVGMPVPSPHNPDVWYRVGRRVHRSTDGGTSWLGISPELASWEDDSAGRESSDGADPSGAPVLASVAESPLEPGLIWVGSADGRVYLTRDGGRSWLERDVPAPAARMRTVALEPSVHAGGRAYVAMAGEESDEPVPFLYRTDDYGVEWTLLSRAGSEIAASSRITVVREDPEGNGLVFAGTSDGVFVSFDTGNSWDRFQFDLPEAEVTDIRVVGRDLLVSTAGRGHFVMDEIEPLRQVMDGLATGEPYLFEPSPTYVDDGRGAIFDYLLPSFVRRVRLEVLDGQGTVLTSFTGPAEETDEQEEDRQIPGTRSGVHRIVWDLSPSEGDGTGVVPPGVYRVRMTVDGLEQERRFEVLSPPGER